MMIKFYNTLTNKKEVFKPIKKGNVGIYSCGPTVYWYQHIGNLRSFFFADILSRTLSYNKYKVKHVINVTDVGHLTSDSDTGEDKVEEAARKEGKKAGEITKFYFNVFEKDLKRMQIKIPWKWVWATKHIDEQIKLIQKLEKKGYTYKTSDGIYFNSKKFKKYGKLANLRIEKLKAGKRIELRDKKNKTDFALWKFSSGNRQQEWKSPWGVGFPGWHLECSAMSMKYLGNHFDIHTGGEEHIPVHHTNEIAQSEAVTGKKFVNYWMHGRWLMFNDEKMSKSKDRILTLSELEKRDYKAEYLRYLFLMTHYMKPLKFTFDNLDAAKNAYLKVNRKVAELRKDKRKGTDRSKQYGVEFLKNVNDDLNTSGALSVFWKALEDFNFDPGKKIKLLEKFDEVLGLGVKNMKQENLKVPGEIKKLISERENLRKNKEYAKSDILRERIREKGYLIVDSSEGIRVEKL